MFKVNDQVNCPDGQAWVKLVIYEANCTKLKLQLFTGELVTWAAKDCEVVRL